MQGKGKKGFSVKRHIVAAIFLPFLVAYLYFLPPPYFLALLIAVGVIAMWEFYAMYKVPARLYAPGLVIAASLLYVSCLYPALLPEGVFIGIFVLLLLRLFLAATPAGCMSELGPVAVGFFYIAGFLSFQWLIRTDSSGREYIFLLYISVWISDSAAYYIGTYMGKNKLCPSISPNKTIEGAFGSVLGGIVGAGASKIMFGIPGLSVQGAVSIGAVMGLTAMIGDLIESMFKRDAGVKDSGNLIPGHGGILDKLDGMLVSGPVLYIIVRYF